MSACFPASAERSAVPLSVTGYTRSGGSNRKEFFMPPLTFSDLRSNLVMCVPRWDTTGEDDMINRRLFATSTLTTAVGLALAMQAPAVQAQGMAKNKLEKCFGINAAAKNDCAEGAHSCAGQATQARDTKSFVLLPAGDCGKIQGGKTTAT